MRLNVYYIITALCACTCITAHAQETVLQTQYRNRVVEYSHDLKCAEKNILASMEIMKATNKDLYPKISGDAHFKYTGNPLELTLQLPSADHPVTFTGKHENYGLGVSVVQPVYTGGRLLESIKMAKYQHEISTYQEEIIHAEVCAHADVQYWNTVARKEIYGIVKDYHLAVASLVNTIRERVESGMTDRQDLLMMEVKYNEAGLQLAQAKKNFDNSMMALNSLVGAPLESTTEIDDSVIAITAYTDLWMNTKRPELKVAETQVQLAHSEHRLTKAKYKPQIAVGMEGNFSSPGYNFKSDLDPNYVVYAQLAVPLFQWGKRSNDCRVSELKTAMALDNMQKVVDNVNLEIQSARNSLQQTIAQTALAENTLKKAYENERLAVERYHEGRASVIEVIEAQTYRQQAQMSLVQAKMAAQTEYAMLLKAVNGYH